MTRQTQAGAILRDLAVVYRPIDSLIPYANNPRTHSRKQIRQIADAISAFGWTNPVLTDDEGRVLGGHGRIEAAELLGLTSIPTIPVSNLSEEQKRAYVIADNAIAEKSGWSQQLLRIELQGLSELGFNLELTGFTSLEIDTLLSFDEEPATPAAEADAELVELPDQTAPVTRPGDHWVVDDRHHLICADACDRLAFEKILGEEKAQLAIFDPPFNTPGARISSRHGDFVRGSGELSDSDFVMRLLRPAMRNVAHFCEPGAIAFVCSDWRAYPRILDATSGVFEEQKNLIVWAKTNSGLGSFYRSQFELIAAFKISRGPTVNNFELGQNGRHRSNLWTYPGANTFRRGRMEDIQDHPTIKPRKLVADAIIDCSRAGDIVLDPFLGSGTLLAAAHVTGRRGYGLELDPRYCDVIIRRLHVLTGKMPRLIDGTPFDVVATARKAGEGEGA